MCHTNTTVAFLVAFIVWACVQYTGGWEDYAISAICCALGYLAKRFRFSRPAVLMGFYSGILN